MKNQDPKRNSGFRRKKTTLLYARLIDGDRSMRIFLEINAKLEANGDMKTYTI